LGRIDTHDIDLVDDDYKYSEAGEGVDVYVIDTYVTFADNDAAPACARRLGGATICSLACPSTTVVS
jgi:hypothetical protein